MTPPPTYLKTQQVADAFGVSVSTIKRWVDSGAIEATRTMGKHRLVPLSNALKFARRENFPIQALLALAGHNPPDFAVEHSVDALEAALKEGRPREASALIVSAYREGGAAALGDRVIRPVLERVGHGWMIGTWDVYEEHQASQVVVSTVTDLIRQGKAERGRRGPLALGCSPEGDPYTIPGLLCELVLVDLGWDVRNLGCNLPLRSLARATRDCRPSLVYLSVGHVADRDAFLRDYPYFYEAASQVGAAIMLGGRGLGSRLRSSLVYAGFGERLAHLAEFGRRLLPGPNPQDTTDTTTPNRGGAFDAHGQTE